MLRDADPAQLVVVDASVVVALVAARGADTVSIGARLAESVLHAPAILATEVDSALRGLERGGKLSSAQASASRAAAHVLPVDLWPWEVLGDRAWELRENVSTFDAGYVALAEHLGAVLLTGDRRLARATGIRCSVEVVALG